MGEWWGRGEYSKCCYAHDRGVVGEWWGSGHDHSPADKTSTATRPSEPLKPHPRTLVPGQPARPSETRTAPPMTSRKQSQATETGRDLIITTCKHEKDRDPEAPAQRPVQGRTRNLRTCDGLTPSTASSTASAMAASRFRHRWATYCPAFRSPSGPSSRNPRTPIS